MDLVDDFKVILPNVCLITDDPYRVRMIAAHYLDNVQIFSEARGQVGLIGEFNHVPLIVMSVGIGTVSTIAYLTELCSKNQMERVIYFGDCITNDSNLSVGSNAYISKAYENDQCFYASDHLLKLAEILIEKNNVNAQACATTTNDNYFVEKKYITYKESKVLDFTTSGLYSFHKNNPAMEMLSILNIRQNIVTEEKMDGALRQSGCHSGVILALQIATYKSI